MDKRLESEITFPYLRRFNLIMGFLHLIQASLMLTLSLLIPQIRDFELPITTAFLEYVDPPGILVPNYTQLGSLPVGILVSLFLFISSIAHFLIT